MDLSFYQILAVYACSAVVFLAVDAVWIKIVMVRLFKDALGNWLRADMKMGIAAAFYLVYTAGIIIFAVLPGLTASSLITSISLGGFFGLCAYATYEITNYATLKKWTAKLVVIDTLWGTFLSAMTAAAGYLAGCLLFCASV